jgi:hypothetical protein
MLVVSFKLNECIIIGDISLRVVEVRGDKVRFHVIVSEDKRVHRENTLDPAWLTWNDGTVLQLARAIAAEGNYDALPILADALEEAGCDNGAILGNCRSCLQDVRRSWLVDLILSVS